MHEGDDRQKSSTCCSRWYLVAIRLTTQIDLRSGSHRTAGLLQFRVIALVDDFISSLIARFRSRSKRYVSRGQDRNWTSRKDMSNQIAGAPQGVYLRGDGSRCFRGSWPPRVRKSSASQSPNSKAITASTSRFNCCNSRCRKLAPTTVSSWQRSP